MGWSKELIEFDVWDCSRMPLLQQTACEISFILDISTLIGIIAKWKCLETTAIQA